MPAYVKNYVSQNHHHENAAMGTRSSGLIRVIVVPLVHLLVQHHSQ